VKFVDEWKNQDSFRYINFTKHSQNANLKYHPFLLSKDRVSVCQVLNAV